MDTIAKDLGFQVRTVDKKYFPQDGENLCAIASLSMFMDQEWEITYDQLADLGKQNHMDMFYINNIREYINKYISEKYYIQEIQGVNPFIYLTSNGKQGKYIVSIIGHMFNVIDGVIYDNIYAAIDDNMNRYATIYALFNKDSDPYINLKKYKNYYDLINRISISHSFKKYNPRRNKSINKYSTHDSAIRALCKIEQRSYSEIYAFLSYIGLNKERSPLCVANIVEFLENNKYINLYNDNESYMSLYDAIKEYRLKEDCIIFVNIFRKRFYVYDEIIYVPIVNGNVYYDDLHLLSEILSCTVQSVYMKQKGENE